MSSYRPTWVEISQQAFASNVQTVKKFIGNNVHLLAVLKADGYGHGASALAPVAVRSGAFCIGVSSLEEGLALRDSGVSAPILILGGIYPLENFEVALTAHLIPTVASLESAHVLKSISQKLNRKAPFHLKVDTGMGRIGVTVKGAKQILQWLAEEKSLPLEGIYSHFASADDDSDFTSHQNQEFEEVKNFAESLGFKNLIFHIANSSGALLYKTSHHGMVRPGLLLYGIPTVPVPPAFHFSPVLSWHSRAIFFKKVPAGTPISYEKTFITRKETEIITLPVGYADGIPRSVSNRAEVLVKGQRCPLIGRVTMDHIMVDVTGLSVKVGEDVVLIGDQGNESITVYDWAQWAGTIPYEIFCGISKRVPRVMTV